ncbi:MAG: signal peptide peptidase SppA [Pseudomonadales bacterium]|nr:signal peptide peptidase SppA [Pseudomonadales bacterium]
MNQTREFRPGRWARIGAALTSVRLFISNLFFFVFLLILLVVLFAGGGGVKIPDGGALILNPGGTIVEQRSMVDPFTRWLNPAASAPDTELGTLLEALERARDDARIRLVVLDLDNLQGVSTAHADTIGQALEAFRATGKEVIAYGSYYGQQPYLMASAADAVYMHPLGQLLLPGYRLQNLYFQSLLERLKINVHVFRAGEYKEFVEPYLRNDMSPEVREANAGLVADLWTHYARRVTERRRIEPDRFERYTQFLDQALAETDGDLARLAVEYQLVDELLTPDQARVRIGDKVGYDPNGDYRGIGFADYVRALGPRPQPADVAGQIGVITAEGPIVASGAARGMIAADQLIDLIRRVRDDTTVRALVLRLDTPGGSSFASELIRQELELLQVAGKPVVVSMGPVAASGGYWIASTADAIVAEPTTLTGSIGVFGIFPTFENSLGAIGVSSDGVATSSLGDMDPFSALSAPAHQVLQASTEHVYRRFVNLVARGRDLPVETVGALAEGRVWLGATAAERGLVDLLGDRGVAVARAAELAGLDTYGLKPFAPSVSPGELFLQQLVDNLALPEQGFAGGLRNPAVGALARTFAADWQLLGALDDPQHLYALCASCLGLPGGTGRPGL